MVRCLFSLSKVSDSNIVNEENLLLKNFIISRFSQLKLDSLASFDLLDVSGPYREKIGK